ncbi:unnamed protein product [Cercopithifilaria johnstoni]|uniref:Uncharacterized protein n=1 Tax=Cercopithifilaria johnstoni TaxID=2874296 RepID=A0A8J2MN03_9BILA|nr:unnamed protein product [Cercopithifilaria johnstoni]
MAFSPPSRWQAVPEPPSFRSGFRNRTIVLRFSTTNNMTALCNSPSRLGFFRGFEIRKERIPLGSSPAELMMEVINEHASKGSLCQLLDRFVSSGRNFKLRSIWENRVETRRLQCASVGLGFRYDVRRVEVDCSRKWRWSPGGMEGGEGR